MNNKKNLKNIVIGTAIYFLSGCSVEPMPENDFVYVGKYNDKQIYLRNIDENFDFYIINDSNEDGLIKNNEDSIIDDYLMIAPKTKVSIKLPAGELEEQDRIFTNLYKKNLSRNIPIPLECVSYKTIDLFKELAEGNENEFELNKTLTDIVNSYKSDVKIFMSDEPRVYTHYLTPVEEIGILYNLNLISNRDSGK